ncbi:MAG: LTA synthase family protein, partial [Eudoraea sp.]
MESKEKISSESKPKTLRDFIRLIISFYLGLVIISLYQCIYLYAQGVLDYVFSKSFFLLLLHNSGFTALIGIFIAFLFNFIEGKRPGLGFKISGLFFLILLVIEFLLGDFYV